MYDGAVRGVDLIGASEREVEGEEQEDKKRGKRAGVVQEIPMSSQAVEHEIQKKTSVEVARIFQHSFSLCLEMLLPS